MRSAIEVWTGREDFDAGAHCEMLRLSALKEYEILDTPREASFDAITLLALQNLGADSAGIGFGAESRVWIKSSCGRHVQELPRENSIFDMVLRENGPVFIPDVARCSTLGGPLLSLKTSEAAFFAAAPVRSPEGWIVGVLTVFGKEARDDMRHDDLEVLQSLADLVADELELRRLRKLGVHKSPCNGGEGNTENESWPDSEELWRALEQNEFVLYYQPEVDLSTRRIVGVEALIRWQHPTRGLVAPMEFIPKAEETGLIVPIGDWGLQEACRQIRQWNREDSRNGSLRVCVNLSARQFARPGLADHVEALLMESSVSSRQLGLEMTESSLIPNMNTAVQVLDELKTLGVSLLMDDFGTGYSSLNYLHSFPFDVLKVDRSFVGRMAEGEQALQIVRTIIELARALGMEVVAEGIETREQFRLLRKLGCKFGQGFLFARPMTAGQISQLLRIPGRILGGMTEAQPVLQSA